MLGFDTSKRHAVRKAIPAGAVIEVSPMKVDSVELEVCPQLLSVPVRHLESLADRLRPMTIRLDPSGNLIQIPSIL